MPPVRYVVEVVERRVHRVVVEEPSRGASEQTIRTLAETQVRNNQGRIARSVAFTAQGVEVEAPAVPQRPGAVYTVLAVNASESEPDKIHEVRRGADGVVYCTCTGYSTHKRCWHMSAFRGDLTVVRRGRRYDVRTTTVAPDGPAVHYSSPALARARSAAQESGQAVRAIILRG